MDSLLKYSLATRGRCGELLGYWYHTEADQSTMATMYFNAIKKLEEESSQNDTGGELGKVACIYEALGLFLKVNKYKI